MQFLTILILSFFINSSFASGEMKEICHNTIKKGKTVHECRKIKVHKKFEGTKVPDKSK